MRKETMQRRSNKHAHAPVPASKKFTVSAAPKPAVETAHVATVNFISELRVGLTSTAELEQALRERQARLQQLERMPKLLRDAALDYQQTKADMLLFQNELMKRKLSRLQREQSDVEQAVESLEEARAGEPIFTNVTSPWQS
jgi:hypothetical protein